MRTNFKTDPAPTQIYPICSSFLNNSTLKRKRYTDKLPGFLGFKNIWSLNNHYYQKKKKKRLNQQSLRHFARESCLFDYFLNSHTSNSPFWGLNIPLHVDLKDTCKYLVQIHCRICAAYSRLGFSRQGVKLMTTLCCFLTISHLSFEYQCWTAQSFSLFSFCAVP